MKKNQFNRWWWALRAPYTQGGATLVLVSIALVVPVAIYTNFHPFPLGVAVFAAVGYAVLVKIGLKLYDENGAAWAAQEWVQSADSPDEAWQRQRSISELGAAGAMGAPGAFDWAPPVNVDGSPMVAGTGTDVHGNTYGSTSLTPDFSASSDD